MRGGIEGHRTLRDLVSGGNSSSKGKAQRVEVLAAEGQEGRGLAGRKFGVSKAWTLLEPNGAPRAAEGEDERRRSGERGVPCSHAHVSLDVWPLSQIL